MTLPADLAEMWGPEPLDEDLKPCVVQQEPWGTCLQHPLVQMVPFAAPMNRMANRMLAQKRAMLARYEEREDWYGYVFAHERPWRPQALYRIASKLGDWAYWRLVGQVWVDTEQADSPYWPLLWGAKRPQRRATMKAKNLKVWQGLPQTLTLFRGEPSPSKWHQRWSWTLSREKAEWFARRWPGRPRVLECAVEKVDALAFFDDRNKQEVVLRPVRGRPVTVHRLPEGVSPSTGVAATYLAAFNRPPEVALDRP